MSRVYGVGWAVLCLLLLAWSADAQQTSAISGLAQWQPDVLTREVAGERKMPLRRCKSMGVMR